MGEVLEALECCTGFQWDEGNADKNWIRHRVSRSECEQVFFNRPLLAAQVEQHSQTEDRFYALGRTDADRWLFVVFTIRGASVRVISARDMSRRERRVYKREQEKLKEEDPEVQG